MRTQSLLTGALVAALTSAQDLATALSGQDSLSSLVDLLGQFPESTDFLASQQGVTLFAPNNEAIAALTSSGAELDPAAVDDLLRYHLYSGEVRSTDLTEVPLFATSYFASDNLITAGQVASINLDGDGNAIVTSGLKAVSTVTTADVEYNNGIIHIIDTVLTIPQPVSDTLLAGGLTALAGAATELDLVSTLEGLGDVTIFAPTYDAFRAIAGAASGLSTAQLATILQYHVISGTVVYSTSLDGNASTPTLQGTNVDITVTPDGALFVDGARVINSDVLIANGVLHIIDAVLNPDEKSPQPGQPGFPPGDGDTVPFTSGIEASSVRPELSGTTSLVAEVLVTAEPEPQVFLLPDGSLSTSGGGVLTTTGTAAEATRTSSGSSMAASTSMSTAVSSSSSGSGAGAASGSNSEESASTTSASTSGAAGGDGESASASESAPAQQTGNAGARKELSSFAAMAVGIVGVGACALGL